MTKSTVEVRIQQAADPTELAQLLFTARTKYNDALYDALCVWSKESHEE